MSWLGWFKTLREITVGTCSACQLCFRAGFSQTPRNTVCTGQALPWAHHLCGNQARPRSTHMKCAPQTFFTGQKYGKNRGTNRRKTQVQQHCLPEHLPVLRLGRAQLTGVSPSLCCEEPWRMASPSTLAQVPVDGSNYWWPLTKLLKVAESCIIISKASGTVQVPNKHQ